MTSHAHNSIRTLATPYAARRTMTDAAALDTIQQVLMTEPLDAVALDRITDLVKVTSRDVSYREAA